jgi:hypothetical protein
MTALVLLQALEWAGYDIAGGERACPMCLAWEYQPENRVHAYGCPLAMHIGAPMEVFPDNLKESK